MRNMTEQEIKQALTKGNWATICTVNKDNSPYAVEATYFIGDDQTVGFMINPGGTTLTNIQTNSHVLLKITLADKSLSEWMGISLFGKGVVINDPDKIRQGWELLGNVMNENYEEAAERFYKTPERSPFLSVKVEKMTGKCSIRPGEAINFNMN